MGLSPLNILLDTHAVIWATENDPRLGVNAFEALNKTSRDQRMIPDILLLEISMLASKNRIKLSLPIEDYLKNVQSEFKVLPINHSIAYLAMSLDLQQADLFDRIITATALFHDIALCTKDDKITKSGLVSVIW